MAEEEHGAGMSRYAGIRVTLTDPRTGARPILTVAVKDRAWGWDRWELSMPAVRPPEMEGVGSTRAAIEGLRDALSWLLENEDI